MDHWPFGLLCTTLSYMDKTEVYSWRVSAQTKQLLAREARQQDKSLGALLDEIAREYLARRKDLTSGDDEAQARLHAAAMKAVGTIHGNNPRRSVEAKATLRARLQARRDR